MSIVLPFNGLTGGSDDQLALTALEGSAALICVYDELENVRFTNAAFRAAYFIEPHEQLNWSGLMRRNFAAGRGTVIESDDIEAWIASVRSRRGKFKTRTYESDLHDGRWIKVVETLQDNGWISYVGTDVTALNANHRMLRLDRDTAIFESCTDDLTGISNRRHIMSILQEVVERSQEGGAQSYACLLDIDFFKKINDALGHQVGDDVLVGCARTVRDCVRLRDGFGRVGGEEFLLVLPGVTKAEATATIERLLRTVREQRYIAGRPDHEVHFSAGYTQVLPEDDVKRVYARCDRALYQAKEGGRNRAVYNPVLDGTA